MATRKWGSEKLVNTNVPGHQIDSHVAGLTGGGFVMVWRDDSTVEATIRAQRYDALGNRAGGEYVFYSQFVAPGQVVSPAVTGLAGGGFYLTYTETFGLSSAILGHVYDANGAFVRSQGITPFGSYGNSEVARLGAGSVVVWEDPSDSGGSTYLKVFDAAGAGGPAILVESSGSS